MGGRTRALYPTEYKAAQGAQMSTAKRLLLWLRGRPVGHGRGAGESEELAAPPRLTACQAVSHEGGTGEAELPCQERGAGEAEAQQTPEAQVLEWEALASSAPWDWAWTSWASFWCSTTDCLPESARQGAKFSNCQAARAIQRRMRSIGGTSEWAMPG